MITATSSFNTQLPWRRMPSLPGLCLLLLLLLPLASSLSSCYRTVPYLDYRPIETLSLVMVPSAPSDPSNEKITSSSPSDWTEGESRTLRIICEPSDVLISAFSLTATDPAMAEILPEGFPGRYTVKALRAGTMTLAASATDTHGNTLTRESSFEVLLSDIPPVYEDEYPDLGAWILCQDEGGVLRREGAPCSEFILSSSDELKVELSSSNRGAVLSLVSSDPDVLSVTAVELSSPIGAKGTSVSSVWSLRAGAGGKAVLRAVLTTSDGQKYQRTYIVYVYSHIALGLEVSPELYELSLSVLRYSGPSPRELSYTLRGSMLIWPGPFQDRMVSVPLEDTKGSFILEGGVRKSLYDYSRELMLTHRRLPYTPEGGTQSYYWDMGALDLGFTFEVKDDPFVIVDFFHESFPISEFELSLDYSQSGVQHHEEVPGEPPLERVPEKGRTSSSLSVPSYRTFRRR